MGLSDDGTTVVGYSSSYDARSLQAFAWRRDTGLIPIPSPAGRGLVTSLAIDVSADGSVVVGWMEGEAPAPAPWKEAFRWTAEGQTVGLGTLPGHTLDTEVRAVSADGTTVLGIWGRRKGFVWNAGQGMVEFVGLSADIIEIWPNAISADGSTIVGTVRHPYPSGTQAFRWRSDEGLTTLSGLSAAYDVSADGSIVMGQVHRVAAIWTESSGAVLLGGLPGSGGTSTAGGLSGDGSIVVGTSRADHPDYPFTLDQAFVWDARHGMRNLADVLRDQGADLTGWVVTHASAISADGRVIAGSGLGPDGHLQAWVAELDRPIPVRVDVRPGSPVNRVDPVSEGLIPVALLGAEDFDVRDVDVASLVFGPHAASPALALDHPFAAALARRDVDRDGRRDLVVHFRVSETGIAYGDEEACLTGLARSGETIEGCDTIVTRPGCGPGWELVALVPPFAWLGQRRRRFAATSGGRGRIRRGTAGSGGWT